jgi:hypothetical protein
MLMLSNRKSPGKYSFPCLRLIFAASLSYQNPVADIIAERFLQNILILPNGGCDANEVALIVLPLIGSVFNKALKFFNKMPVDLHPLFKFLLSRGGNNKLVNKYLFHDYPCFSSKIGTIES